MKLVASQVSYENRIEELEQEIKDLKMKRQEVETEYSTLKRTVQNKEEETVARRAAGSVGSETAAAVSARVRNEKSFRPPFSPSPFRPSSGTRRKWPGDRSALART